MALNAPFVMKLSYYSPGEENREKNLAHIDYIIRRGAVDYGAIEPENKKSVEAAKKELEKEELIHLQYMHERPRSEGLFDENGNASIKDVKNALKNHDGIVWRCIVSLREDDAVKLDHIDRSAWEASLKDSFIEIQEKLGIPASNFRWTAAYHPEPGHPHCHILFWEERPERVKGKLSLGEMTDTRKAFVKNICAPERERLLTEKTYYREAIRNGAKDILQLKKDLNRESERIGGELGGKSGIAPYLLPEKEQLLSDKLEHLSELLPGHGRVALKYMPEEVKKEAREAADWLMSQPGFIEAKEQYLQANQEIINTYMRDQPSKIEQAMARAYNDLRDRVAQDVLKAAVYRQQLNQKAQYHEKIVTHQFINSFWKGVWMSIQREKTRSEYQARVMQAQIECGERRREGRQR